MQEGWGLPGWETISHFYALSRQLCGSAAHAFLVLLKALSPVCMIHTARGESQVVNIA